MSADNTGSHVMYSDPPVTETSLGLQFTPIAGWDAHLFGAFLELVRDRYPAFSSAPPISATPAAGAGSFEFNIFPLALRGLFTSENGRDVVQIQDSFFLVNWRRIHGEEYSRYTQLQGRFERDWRDFALLLEKNGLAVPEPTRCLLTYVDHAEQARFSAHDLMKDWQQSSGLTPRALNISSTYRLDDGAEASVTLQPALRIADNKPVHQLTIALAAAYNKAASMSLQFENLHARSNDLFNALSSPEAQLRWGKESLR